MDVADAFDIADALMSRRMRRRLLTLLVVILAAAGLVAPRLQLTERLLNGFVEMRTRQFQEILDEHLHRPPPTASAGRSRSANTATAPRAAGRVGGRAR
jgi:hypothetical protein